MDSIQVFNFNNATVRTVELNGAVWFIAKDVTDLLGYANSSKAISDHCKGANESLLPSAGGEQITKIIPERDLYRLIMRSRLPEAEKFEDWVVGEVLPSIRKTGSYSVKSAPSDKIEELKLSQIAWSGLGVNDNSKLLLTHKFFNHYNITTVALPDYTESKDTLKALSTLLKDHDVGMSAMKLNKILQSAGIIEQLTRPSSKGGEKTFWSIKDKSFGENQVSPANPRETQPLFYTGKFADLLKAVNQPSLF